MKADIPPSRNIKYILFLHVNIKGRARPKSGPGRQFAAVSYNTCYGDTGLIGCVVLGNSIFHTRKTLSESYPQLCHVSSKVFVSPGLQQKSLKNLVLK